MALAENRKEYVLQWTGHAAHVTERFSGLLARQALVDVTLICQGQKLRVHKLVLASSSLYFEEMLEQDLGQEPTILLRDLDFEVLKAMVEFMYCGETTISQCHLQTLLDAAQVFKVKELECIVETMMKSKTMGDKNSSEFDGSSPSVNTIDVKNNRKARPSGERYDEKCPASDIGESEIFENKGDRVLDISSRTSYIDDENSLYEIPNEIDEPMSCQNEEEPLDRVSLDTLDSESSMLCTTENDSKEKVTVNEKMSSYTEENPLKSCYDETRCDLIKVNQLKENTFQEQPSKNRTKNHDLPRGVGECSRVYTHKKRKYIDNEESNEETIESSGEIFSPDENVIKELPRPHEKDKNSGRSLKVYTHKRRKSVDERKCQIFDTVCDSTEEPITSTSSIDLNDDTSLNNAPINLSNGLDMETSEYIWSLSTESIQYVVGCTINSMNSRMADSETKNKVCEDTIEKNRHDARPCNQKKTQQIKELFSCENGNGEISETPVLRRSVRINQLESDDSLNNNNGTISVPKVREKSSDIVRNDYGSSVTMPLTKSSKRRCNKDQRFRITDENVVESPGPLFKKTTSSRSLRSGGQLSSKKSKISRNEQTRNTRQNRDKSEKSDSSDILVNTRLNTIASVDRALWGDMSDFLENRDDSSDELLNYSTSREIPFAVGLLPLRAALERMQATVDHQPRKTRSSVAPWRQETVSLRKKFVPDFDNSNLVKKQHNSENENIETAICHIEIRTSSSPDKTQNSQMSTDDRIITVGSHLESNKQ
ncbi:uncharacterized protein [Venturia canescens]|nr:uncharacterized protein LOC122419372 isoform X2 [Venturia canescens]XP_043289799.1 uncharacterized protein LOC122419372 isoform X2 [Venturia canescens]